MQESLPIQIASFGNAALGSVDIEQKAAGLDRVYTHLRNPAFGKLAGVVGLWGRSVSMRRSVPSSGSPVEPFGT